jgi:hypothetical protein
MSTQAAISEQNLYVSWDLAAETDVSGVTCSVSMLPPNDTDDWTDTVAAAPPEAIQNMLLLDSPLFEGIQRVWFRVATGPDKGVAFPSYGRNTVHGRLSVATQTIYRRWAVDVPKE